LPGCFTQRLIGLNERNLTPVILYMARSPWKVNNNNNNNKVNSNNEVNNNHE
jgi:hypothetical protein